MNMLRATSSLLFASLLSLGPMSNVLAAPPPKHKLNLPPPATLAYSIKALQSGMTITGDGILKWTAGGGKYLAESETRAMIVGKILDAKSEGTVDAYGLAPASFSEKRLRRERSTTTFDRAGKTISFSAAPEKHSMVGGEQDRSSIIWQLVGMARAAPAKFKPGASWTFMVAGNKNAEPWTFKVGKQEKIRTAQGDLNAVRISRLPPDAKGQQLDLWLAPSLEWYPVRLRWTEDNDESIEQTLQSVTKNNG